MEQDKIVIRGARENNLKNVSLDIPRNKLVVMGPEGGDGGGTVVTAGTPEQVAQVEQSWTGQYLRKALAR